MPTFGFREPEINGLCAFWPRVAEVGLDGTEEYLFVNGRIYKTAQSTEGKPHAWVAPAIIERVIEVLEQLSASLRNKCDRTELLLTSRSGTGWLGERPGDSVEIIAGPSVGKRLNRHFGLFIGLPKYRGKTWHWSTHQGRKTFARFIAKEDRSGLHALKEHFGHRSVVITDQAYAGADYEMSELIGQAAQEEMVTAYAEALTAERLAGATGARINERSPFRGQLVKDGALEYARRRLNDTGSTFHRCDYGYCYYSQRHAACHGDEYGPNHALRTQNTCVDCKNFIVVPKHGPVWEERRRAYVEFLQSSDTEDGIRGTIEEKISECDRVLSQLGQGVGTQEARP